MTMKACRIPFTECWTADKKNKFRQYYYDIWAKEDRKLKDKSRDMTRVNRIWNHSVYQSSLHNIEELERERIFCGHGVRHLLDTARLAYIENLEMGLGISKDMIYAAALLHDIGRGLQYTEGIPHHEGGVKLAAPILKDCGFTDAESEEILEAIGGHRDTSAKGKRNLAGILYRADKGSRCCFSCPAQAQCSWSAEKKNMYLTV